MRTEAQLKAYLETIAKTDSVLINGAEWREMMRRSGRTGTGFCMDLESGHVVTVLGHDSVPTGETWTGGPVGCDP